MRLSPLLLLPLLVLIAGCESARPDPKAEAKADTTPVQDDKAAIAAEIAALAKGKDPTDAADSKAYDDALAKLISRGSGIETTLIDSLRRADDWGVRLGLVEVLMATGTKASVEHLIVCLDDAEPLVAQRANKTLQEMTSHTEIPESGPAGANGLPPVPRRAEGDLALDADLRLWSQWQKEHGARLRQAWSSWWSANRDQITVK